MSPRSYMASSAAIAAMSVVLGCGSDDQSVPTSAGPTLEASGEVSTSAEYLKRVTPLCDQLSVLPQRVSDAFGNVDGSAALPYELLGKLQAPVAQKLASLPLPVDHQAMAATLGELAVSRIDVLEQLAKAYRKAEQRHAIGASILETERSLAEIYRETNRVARSLGLEACAPDSDR